MKQIKNVLTVRLSGFTAITLAMVVSMIALSLAGCEAPIGEDANQTPVAADYDFGNLSQTAGSVTAVTITAKSGKFTVVNNYQAIFKPYRNNL